METALVTILCLALIVVGGMTLTQGYISSADTARAGVADMNLIGGDSTRTGIGSLSASNPDSDAVEVFVENTGQTKLASFEKWDIIVHYTAADGIYVKRLDYTTGGLSPDEWQKTAIYLQRTPTEIAEAYEPDILNPGEILEIDALLEPEPEVETTVEVTVCTPNGVYGTTSFTVY